MDAVAFYFFAFLAIVGGILMVSFRNPLNGAFSLVLSLVSIAFLFAQLHAEFIFVLQILVYGGAIMVLVIFTIMLLNLSKEELREAPVGKIRMLFTMGICALGALVFIRVLGQIPSKARELPEGFGNIAEVGRLMLTEYLYPFEVISVLLLVAVVGVVLLAKREI